MSDPDTQNKYRILDKQIGYNKFLQINELKLQFRRFDGKWSEPVERIVLQKGPAAAVVLYLTDIKKLVLVKQFRYPGTIVGQPWLEELVAGTVDHGENAEKAMKRELMEESGFEVEHLESLGQFFVSPGYCTEVIHLYYAEATLNSRKEAGGGLDSEEEDLEVIFYTENEVRKKLLQGAFLDAKTIIGLQQFLLRGL